MDVDVYMRGYGCVWVCVGEQAKELDSSTKSNPSSNRDAAAQISPGWTTQLQDGRCTMVRVLHPICLPHLNHRRLNSDDIKTKRKERIKNLTKKKGKKTQGTRGYIVLKETAETRSIACVPR